MCHERKERANKIIEEEKKILAPMLGKLHISPAASADKLRELCNEVNIAVDGKLVSDATGRNAMVKLHGGLTKIVNAMGEPAARATPGSNARDSSTPEVDADTPIESTEIQDEESLAKETSELSITDTAVSVDPEDLEEPSYDEDDATALMNQLNAEVERAEESILLDDSVMDNSVADESRETSVLSIRPKSRGKSASAQPGGLGQSARSSRARDSLVNELLSDDSGEETL